MSAYIFHGPQVQTSCVDITLGEFFFNLAQQYRENICHVDADTDESETYSSVLQRSIRLALQLQSYGVTSKDVIATCCYNSINNVIPIIATTFLGAKIANLDPSLSQRDIKHLLSLTNPTIVYVSTACVDLVKSSVKNTKIITIESILSDLLIPHASENEFRPVKVNVHDIAWILFSSGTTGFPKGICHSHYTVLQITETFKAWKFDMSVSMCFTTFYWISTLIVATTTFLQGGIRVFSNVTDGKAILKAIEKNKVTFLSTAPIHTYNFINVTNTENYNLSSFAHLVTGGTSISKQQLTKLKDIFKTTQISHAYGQSEIGIVVTFDRETSKSVLEAKIGSTGKVAANTSLKIVDLNTEDILKPYQTGEIRLKSSSCFIGYYKQEDNNFIDADGFLKTGDLGYVDSEGYLYVVGRLKEVFKYKSWPIVPASIESVLMEHSDVKECIVYGIPDDQLGGIPAAAVVLNEKSNASETEIKNFVAAKVLDREQLRGGVKIMKSLPRTATGKIIRSGIETV